MEHAMPCIDIRITDGSLDETQMSRIVERITAAAMAAEGLPDNAISRSISVVTVGRHDRVFVGGKPAQDPRFHVTIHAFADALDDTTRRQLVAEVTQAFRAEHPGCDEGRGRTVWCIINELPAATFAVGGALVSLQQVRALTGQV
jgi:phenylpyruvate tautomerase PptA (4-oxalocrotonate tautomerase family)